jgi:hypothetical protein
MNESVFTWGAKGLSYLFHPIFMPFWGLVLMTRFDPFISLLIPLEFSIYLYAAVFFLTILAPGLSILFMKRNGLISSIKMEERSERTGPFVLMLFYFLLTYYLFRRVPLPSPLYGMIFGAMLVNALVILINLKFKISIHSAAVWGVCGAFLAVFQVHYFFNFLLIAALVIVASLISSSRVYLGDHELSEVVSGAFLGFGVVYYVVLNGFFI